MTKHNHRTLPVRILAFILMTIISLTSMPFHSTQPMLRTVQAAPKRLDVKDTEGDILAPLTTVVDQNNKVYTKPGQNESMGSLGRSNNFETWLKVTNSESGKVDIELTQSYKDLYNEFKSEVNVLETLMKEYNETEQSGIGLQFDATKTLIDKHSLLGGDNADGGTQKASSRYNDIKALKNSYNNLKNSPSSFVNTSPGTAPSTRINRLRVLALAIEYQSRRVQILGGALLPLDYLLINDNTDSKETTEATKAVIEQIKSNSLSSSSPSEISKTLGKTFYDKVTYPEGETKPESLDFDFTKSKFINLLKQDKDSDYLTTYTRAFDLIDIWSTSPWQSIYAVVGNKADTPENTQQVANTLDTDTEEGGYKETEATKKLDYPRQDTKKVMVGGANLYTLLMSDYRITDNLDNSLSKTFMIRDTGNDKNSLLKFGEAPIEPSDKTLPTISTQYSQVFSNYFSTDHQDANTDKELAIKGPRISPLANMFYTTSIDGNSKDDPLYSQYQYYTDKISYDENTTPDSSAPLGLSTRRVNRFFLTGIDDTDGIDLMESYFDTLLSITSKETFINIMNTRYISDENAKYKVSDDGSILENQPSAELKAALSDWDTNERFTFMYAINLIMMTEQLYNKFGKSVYTEDLQKEVQDTIDFISEQLKANGLEPLVDSISNKDTELNKQFISGTEDYNIIRDFISQEEWGYELNEDYKELFAWTACFLPFETNLYQEGLNLTHVSQTAQAKYKRYSRLRQPISIITQGSPTTQGAYQALLQNSPQRLEYCTLSRFIEASQTGDAILFATSVDRDQVSTGRMITTINTNVQTNIEQTSPETTTPNSNSTTDSDTTDSEETTEATSASTPTPTSTSTVETTEDSEIIKDLSDLTSSEKYFGPIYAASDNYSYQSSLVVTKDRMLQFLENSTYITYDMEDLYNNPDALKLATQAIITEEGDTNRSAKESINTTDVRTQNDTSATEISERDSSLKNNSSLIQEYPKSTLLTLQIVPQALFLNHMLAYNIFKTGKQNEEGFQNDMNSILYMDFLGNIITESGYVVIPAAANATRYSSPTEYPIFNAAFLNSYPKIKQIKTKDSPTQVELTGVDEGKYTIAMRQSYLEASAQNPYNLGKVTGTDEYYSGMLQDSLDEALGLTESGTSYDRLAAILLKQNDSLTELRIMPFCVMSYVATGDTYLTEESVNSALANKPEEESPPNLSPSTEQSTETTTNVEQSTETTTREFKVAGIQGKPVVNLPDKRTAVSFMSYRSFNNEYFSANNMDNLTGSAISADNETGSSVLDYDANIDTATEFYKNKQAEKMSEEDAQARMSALIGMLGGSQGAFAAYLATKYQYSINNAYLTGVVGKTEEEILDEYHQHIQEESYKKILSGTEKIQDTFEDYNLSGTIVQIHGLNINGIQGTATLINIPPDPLSYEWLAIKTLNQNLYKIWESDPVEFNGNKIDCFINFNSAVGAMIAAHEGTDDTSVYDSAGNFIAGAGTPMDEGLAVKDDTLTTFFGQFFESIYGPYLASNPDNQLTFAVTLDRTDISTMVPIIVVPAVMVIIILIAIVLLYMMATLSLKNYNVTIGQLFGSFCLTILVGIFIIEWSVPTIKFIFEGIPTWLMQDQLMMQGMYDIENSTKSTDNTFFLEEAQSYKQTPYLKFGTLSVEDCREYRKTTERPDVDYIWYRPVFDNQEQMISGSLKLRGNTVYITMEDLFNKSSVKLERTDENTTVLNNHLDDSAREIIYYTPYYNFVESITSTLNMYAKAATSNYMVINNKQGATTTGRVNDYVNSIFFISPDDIYTYAEEINKNRETAQELMDKIGRSFDYAYTREELNKSEVRLEDGTVAYLDAELVKVYSNFEKEIVDMNDWLQIKRMLYLSETTGPFSTQYEDSIKNSRWFPHKAMEKLTPEQIEEKIYKINNNVRYYVTNNFLDSSAYISDESLIKIIALKATFEFNKEFGDYLQGGPNSAYPRQVEGYKGNNDYFTKAMYIAPRSLYTGAGRQFAYYISANSGYIAMAAITVERLLYMFRLIVRHVSLFITIINLFLMYIFYITRNRLGNAALARITLVTALLSITNLLDIGQFLAGVWAVNNGYDSNATTILHLVLGIIITVIVSFGIRQAVKFVPTFFKSFGLFIPGFVGALTGGARNNYQQQYQYDNTDGMYTPQGNSYQSYTQQQQMPYSNEYNFTDTQIDIYNQPIQADVLPLGNDPNNLPDGYTLYQRSNSDGSTSYYASQTNNAQITPNGHNSPMYRVDTQPQPAPIPQPEPEQPQSDFQEYINPIQNDYTNDELIMPQGTNDYFQ